LRSRDHRGVRFCVRRETRKQKTLHREFKISTIEQSNTTERRYHHSRSNNPFCFRGPSRRRTGSRSIKSKLRTRQSDRDFLSKRACRARLEDRVVLANKGLGMLLSQESCRNPEEHKERGERRPATFSKDGRAVATSFFKRQGNRSATANRFSCQGKKSRGKKDMVNKDQTGTT